MNRDTRNTLIACGAILAVFCILIGGVYAYSGVNPPFSTINSSSMQHINDESRIGTIDTGDMVIVKDPDRHDIVTYVEGSKTGYSKFGEYGDVIIYKTQTNNIIHRAMIHLTLKDIEYHGDEIMCQTWYIPSLEGYNDWTLTKNGSNVLNDDTIWNPVENTIRIEKDHKEIVFELTDVGYSDVDVPIKLWYLGLDKEEGYNGYLTKGDNANTNKNFDQTSLSQMRNKLVTEEDIKSIAMMEIPWLGCLKLLINGKNTDQIPTNSIVDLIVSIVVIIAIAFALNYVLTRKRN